MILGIGQDTCDIRRIEAALERFGERFERRVFTDVEQALANRRRQRAATYAKRFAAKEAIAKAFGTGIGKELGWLDMEITRKDSGEPSLLLSGAGKAYAEANGIAEVKISLSHAHHYAAANAVALGGDQVSK